MNLPRFWKDGNSISGKCLEGQVESNERDVMKADNYNVLAEKLRDESMLPTEHNIIKELKNYRFPRPDIIISELLKIHQKAIETRIQK